MTPDRGCLVHIAHVGYLGAVVLFCLVLAGCSTSSSSRDGDPGPIRESWNPHALYLLSAPYSRLHVEVDAVQGCEPDEVALEKLRRFLSASCAKPDGVEIRRSDVIPRDAARGFSEKALARKYMAGPDVDALPAAFMYVLFFDDALLERGVATKGGQSSVRTPGPRRTKPMNPYTDVWLYPAIYFNTRYFPRFGRNEALVHEAGHILGLASRPGYEAGRHCPRKTCLMNTSLSMSRWFVGFQRGLCRDCGAELKQDSRPSEKLRYVGPVLVRSEAGYHVLSLPDRAGLVVGSLTEQNCDEFAEAMRRETGPGNDRSTRVHCMVKDDMLGDVERLSGILGGFRDDPWKLVRDDGAKVLYRALASRYKELKQYTNAVELLGRAVALDPKDDWCHNELAWIKATCPDDSVRNGNDAVAAANKACELTAWKNGHCIDTLAAAWAEAGDFKRAIQMQEQALRTGEPIEAEVSAMKERLSLYQQSRPFRTKSK